MKIFPDIQRHYVMPIFAAAERGHIEIVKFFIENSQENQAQLLDADGNTLLMAAIKSKNLDLVKFLMPLMTDLNKTNRYTKGAIHYAIHDYEILKYLVSQPGEILKYLVSQPGVDPNLQNENTTALQMLSREDTTFELKIPPGDIAKMIRILAPLSDKTHFTDNILSSSPLQMAASSDSIEALKALLEFFDPNEKCKEGLYNLPIDSAILQYNIEAVKILAPLTKDLNKIMSKHRRNNKKKSIVLDIVQTFIDERKGIINDNSCETCKKPDSNKIRVEPRVDNLYELPFGNEFKVFTRNQIERMIQQFNPDQSKNSLEEQRNL